MPLPKILQSNIVAISRLFTVETLDLEFSNGTQTTFERLPKRGREAVIVCAITHDNHVVLIKEYLAGINRYELVLPKGRVDLGESFSEAANRELKEEAGFGAKSLHYMRELTIAPSHMGFSVHAILAQELYPESIEGDEPEPLEVVLWPLDKLDELYMKEDFSEARSIATLRLAETLLRDRDA